MGNRTHRRQLFPWHTPCLPEKGFLGAWTVGCWKSTANTPLVWVWLHCWQQPSPLLPFSYTRKCQFWLNLLFHSANLCLHPEYLYKLLWCSSLNVTALPSHASLMCSLYASSPFSKACWAGHTSLSLGLGNPNSVTLPLVTESCLIGGLGTKWAVHGFLIATSLEQGRHMSTSANLKDHCNTERERQTVNSIIKANCLPQ